MRGNSARDSDLIVAILKALGRAGGPDALPQVASLAHTIDWLPRQRRVRDAARTCMTAIEVRIQNAEARAVPPQAQDAATAGDIASDATQESTEQEVPAEVLAKRADLQAQLAELLEERSQRSQPAMRWGFLFASYCCIVPYTGFQSLLNATDGQWLIALIWAILCAMATQLHRITLTTTDTEAARKLAAYEDVRGIGTLAEALEWPDTNTRIVAAIALTRLLPKLRASDNNLLSAQQRGCLYRMLKMSNASREEALILAILQALEQIGDEKAVPYVKQLAESPFAFAPAQKRVQKAAQECLPYLEDRAHQHKLSQTLLRASQETTYGPEVLLRPAQSSGDTDPQQLLRAGMGEAQK